jgi:hypothetical protein
LTADRAASSLTGQAIHELLGSTIMSSTIWLPLALCVLLGGFEEDPEPPSLPALQKKHDSLLDEIIKFASKSERGVDKERLEKRSKEFIEVQRRLLTQLGKPAKNETRTTLQLRLQQIEKISEGSRKLLRLTSPRDPIYKDLLRALEALETEMDNVSARLKSLK